MKKEGFGHAKNSPKNGQNAFWSCEKRGEKRAKRVLVVLKIVKKRAKAILVIF
jgi:hypothetical protein